MNEQIKKVNGDHDAIFDYEVKYVNGAISNPASLDALLDEENDGSKRVIRLAMTAYPSDKDVSKGRVGVRFSDVSFESNSDDVPLAYSVKSDNQDWAFIAASTIEERIDKVKSVGLVNLLAEVKSGLGYSMIVIFLFLSLGLLLLVQPSLESLRESLEQIKNTTTDPIEFLYRVELLNLTARARLPVKAIFVLPLVVSLVMLVLLRVMPIWIPIYTFYWGDNTGRYDRKMNILKFVGAGVVVAAFVGIGVNYLSAKLF